MTGVMFFWIGRPPDPLSCICAGEGVRERFDEFEGFGIV